MKKLISSILLSKTKFQKFILVIELEIVFQRDGIIREEKVKVKKFFQRCVVKYNLYMNSGPRAVLFPREKQKMQYI